MTVWIVGSAKSVVARAFVFTLSFVIISYFQSPEAPLNSPAFVDRVSFTDGVFNRLSKVTPSVKLTELHQITTMWHLINCMFLGVHRSYETHAM